jgi:hypothetical protein
MCWRDVVSFRASNAGRWNTVMSFRATSAELWNTIMSFRVASPELWNTIIGFRVASPELWNTVMSFCVASPELSNTIVSFRATSAELWGTLGCICAIALIANNAINRKWTSRAVVLHQKSPDSRGYQGFRRRPKGIYFCMMIWRTRFTSRLKNRMEYMPLARP